MVNFPLASVMVPVELPFTLTETPANGALFSVITFPFTVIFCCANENREKKRGSTNSRTLVLFCKNDSNFLNITINLVKK